MFTVLGGAAFFALALVVDGGRQLGALTEARDLADNLARAGAQGVDVDQWRDTGVPVIDPALAQVEINRVLAASNPTTSLSGAPTVTVTGETITVQVQLNAPRSLFWPNRTVTATESADAVSGVDGP